MLALSGLIVLLLLGAFLAFLLDDPTIDSGGLTARINALHRWGPAAVVALMVVHCFIPFPAEILALSAGAVFGTAMGTALIWTGAMIGAALSFWLSRYLGRAAIERMLSRRHRGALEDWAVDQGAFTLLVSRFIPVIAFNLINYAAGLTRVSWWTFLWTTGVGILPLTALMVYLGARMAEMSWPLLLGVSAAGIAVIWGMHWAAKRAGWLGRPSGRD